MESIKNSNSSCGNGQIMTLKGYYRNLPEATYPKSNFIRDVAARCGVTEVTVRNWIKYGMKPSNPEHIAILSEMTSISSESLWND